MKQPALITFLLLAITSVIGNAFTTTPTDRCVAKHNHHSHQHQHQGLGRRHRGRSIVSVQPNLLTISGMCHTGSTNGFQFRRLLLRQPRGGGKTIDPSSWSRSSTRRDSLSFVRHATKQNAADGGDVVSTSHRRNLNIPAIVYTLNSSTKWLVTIAHTVAVWSRRDFIAPFIVVGSIGAVYLTNILKQIINQSRPSDAPIADPGMPSSHSLVTFFAAVAWSTATSIDWGGSGFINRVLLVGSAFIVAILRVVCGYHSMAQIIVGAMLGSILGKCWVLFGETVIYASNPHAAFWFAWSAYLSGSMFFIGTNIRHWVNKDAHH